MCGGTNYASRYGMYHMKLVISLPPGFPLSGVTVQGYSVMFVQCVRHLSYGMYIWLAACTVLSESCHALIKDVGSDVHEPQSVKTESNSYTPYRYCTSTDV
jgi:hypothetical protein